MPIDVSDANVGDIVTTVDGSREIGENVFTSLIQRDPGAFDSESVKSTAYPRNSASMAPQKFLSSESDRSKLCHSD
jgi:hypothetical protein